jgi:hypothetical protein
MEKLYRKVTFEIDEQDHNRTVLVGKNANFIFNPNTKNGEELTDFLSGCEDGTAQLKADKEELVSFLENLSHNVFWKGRTLDSRDKLKIKTLIQKMKQ